MARIKGIFGDPKARVIKLQRNQKKQYAAVAEQHIEVTTTRRDGAYGIFHAEMPGYTWKWKCGGYLVGDAGK